MGEKGEDTNTGVAVAVAPSTTVVTSNALSAREIEWAENTNELIDEHKRINENGSIIRTRFPPEPNGYLHMGHAKSINMNFSLAFDKLNVPHEHRRTVFRYDDTNPDAESQEYIDSFVHDLEWLGFQPEKTTYSSDNFQTLYDLAIILIKNGLAYCCDMTKLEMEIQRETAMKRVVVAGKKENGVVIEDKEEAETEGVSILLPGRNRNTSVERNLDIFEKMKCGLYDEGTWTLRLKMDFESSNPNMYDLVAYRIRYTSHPHAGNGWCIYPNYDFTHGICDSIEHIDYSICTLEFETRREPYYWILKSLNMFRPKVYEMSRLNLQYTVLSKRRLLKIVTNGIVRGWNDPRMPTLSGYRRRGFTPQIINKFCTELGATRAANVIEMEKLFTTARLLLSATTQRAMAVLEPIKIVITNWEDSSSTSTSTSTATSGAATATAATDSATTDTDVDVAANNPMMFQVQNSPTDPSMGYHTVEMTSTLYIDSTDFRLVDESDYYGLAPNKAVGLKYYGGNLICDEVVFVDDTNNDDKEKKKKKQQIKELICHLDNSDTRTKPKTWISWVPNTGLPCEIRVYNHLFTVPEPTDLWQDEINSNSEIIYHHGFIDPSVRSLVCKRLISPIKSNQALQFERMGYFVVDVDSTFDSTITTTTTNPNTTQGTLIFNRTVTLKEEIFKKKATLSKRDEDANVARKQKQKADLEAKEARMKLDPKDLFRLGEEYQGKYSKFDPDTGIPTHYLAEGTELTKSAMKKLKKEQEKHAKQLKKKKSAGHK